MPLWRFEGLVGPRFSARELGNLAPTIPLVRCAADFLSVSEQPALALSLSLSKPDLFHATSFSLPALWRGRLVATLHDACHLALREEGTLAHAAYYRFVVGPRARSASALITVSEFSRRELSSHLELRPEQLRVIANGVDESFHPSTPSELEDFRARRGLPSQYFAVVGNSKAYKNLSVLHPIVSRLKAPLVLLAGRRAQVTLGFGDEVIDLSPLLDEELVRFYSGALAVLIPSRYEGFGLPALEAMACGAPVIASNAGALPEVVGDAGLLVSPDSSLAWLDATTRIANDEPLRERLRAQGLKRVQRYSWDECAEATLSAYRAALERV